MTPNDVIYPFLFLFFSCCLALMLLSQFNSEFLLLLQQLCCQLHHWYQQLVTALYLGSAASTNTRVFGLATEYVMAFCLSNRLVYCFQIHQGALCLGSTASKTTRAEHTLQNVEC